MVSFRQFTDAWKFLEKAGFGRLITGAVWPSLVLCFLCTGCAAFKSGEPYYYHPKPSRQPAKALPPPAPVGNETNTVQVAKKFQKWNPVWWLGNVDSPVPPDWYRPNDPNRNWRWYFRNPFHNFDFYVIGIADKEFVRVGRYPEKIGNPNGGWNWAVTKYKWLRLPFISYQNNIFNFYIGWRTAGNFGIKINFGPPKKKKSPPPEKSSSPGQLSPSTSPP